MTFNEHKSWMKYNLQSKFSKLYPYLYIVKKKFTNFKSKAHIGDRSKDFSIKIVKSLYIHIMCDYMIIYIVKIYRPIL